MSVTPSTPYYSYRRGVFRTTKILAPASVMINPGDFVWDNNGVAAVASTFTWNSDTVGTQHSFKPKFLGISLDQRLATDATDDRFILVMTEGDCYYPCSTLSGGADIGTYFGLAKDSGNNLLDQLLVEVSGSDLAVAKLLEVAASGAEGVQVHVVSGEALEGII